MTLIARAAIAAAAVSLLMLAVVGGVAYMVVREQTIRSGLEVSTTKAQAVTLRVESRLRTATTLVQSLAENLVVRNALLDTAGRSTYLAPFFHSIAAVDGHPVSIVLADFLGQPLVSEGPEFLPSADEIAWLAQVVEAGKPDLRLRIVAEVVREIVVAYPVIFPNTSSAEGALLLRLTAEDLLVPEHNKFEVSGLYRLLVAGTMPSQEQALDHRMIYTAIEAQLAGRPLHLRLSTQVESHPIEGALAELQRVVLLIGLLLVALAVGLSVLAARRVVMPLRELATTAQHIVLSGSSGTTLLPHGGAGEIGQLAQAFNEMLSRLRTSAELELRGSEARYQAIIESAVNAIITIDTVGEVKSFNPAAEAVFGYPAYEVVGRNVKMLMPSPYREEHDGYLNNYLTTGVRKIIGSIREVTAQRRDGTVFPAELSVSEFQYDGARMFTGIVVDISERQRIDRMKNEFISTVSHELRTPLTSISGSLGMIMTGRLGELPDKVRSMIDIAQRNSTRLIGLVNDLLDMEKIQSGRMTYQLDPVDLVALVNQSVEGTGAFAEARQVHFTVAAEAAQAPVEVDAGRIVQVITNLLSNAAKFSPPRAEVRIAVAETPLGFRVSVRDEGPGISDEFRSRIFARFSQADASDTRGKGGSGLGLAISKAIVEAHRGRIGFDSVPGAGATFYFDLPRGARKQPGTHPAPVPAPHPPPFTVPPPQPAATAAPQAGEALSGRRVLIVEDDPDAAVLIGTTIADLGMRYDVAGSAEEALQMVKATPYDLVTVDIRLPGQDGLWLIMQLRKLEHGRTVPIVVVSAWAEESREQVVGVLTGVEEWLEKPFDAEQLRNTIRRAIRPEIGAESRILYVEDDVDLGTVLSAELADLGRVTRVGTLSAARAALRESAFDLVLLDVGLPDGSGLELLPQVQALSGQPQVIIFSGDQVQTDVGGRVRATLLKTGTSREKLRAEISAALAPHKPVR